MSLVTSLKSCFCPQFLKGRVWSGQWSWQDIRQLAPSFIYQRRYMGSWWQYGNALPTGASSFPPVHLLLKIKQNKTNCEGIGEGGRITSFVCQTDFHWASPRMGPWVGIPMCQWRVHCVMKSHEKAGAKLWITEKNIPWQWKMNTDSSFKYFLSL